MLRHGSTAFVFAITVIFGVSVAQLPRTIEEKVLEALPQNIVEEIHQERDKVAKSVADATRSHEAILQLEKSLAENDVPAKLQQLANGAIKVMKFNVVLHRRSIPSSRQSENAKMCGTPTVSSRRTHLTSILPLSALKFSPPGYTTRRAGIAPLAYPSLQAGRKSGAHRG